MNTEKETKKILNDEVANIILTDESLREYQLELISKIIGINKEVLKNDFELITPRINENVNHKYSTVDAIFENHAIIVNIEVNLIKNEETFTKSSRYLCQLLLKQIKKGKKDKIEKHIYQINLNDFDLYKKGELLYESILMEKKYFIERPYNKETIYDINIDYLRNVKYDTIKKERNSLEKLLYIFICEDKERRARLYSEGIMERVNEKIDNLQEDLYADLYYDHDEFMDRCFYSKGMEDGIEQGIKEGAKQNSIAIAKDMLFAKEPIDKIVKYTHLSIDVINDLKEE